MNDFRTQSKDYAECILNKCIDKEYADPVGRDRILITRSMFKLFVEFAFSDGSLYHMDQRLGLLSQKHRWEKPRKEAS